jgi:uncharacterized damage-inducible protein DinB
MSERAESLASAFENANNELIAAVEACTDEQWRQACSDEGWSVGVTAHHVASSQQPIAGFVQMIANDQPIPPVTMEMFDAANAQHAQEHANCTKAETLELLRTSGQAAAEMLRGLTDEQLNQSQPMPFAGGQPWSAADFAERILIGHPVQHGASVKAATT